MLRIKRFLPILGPGLLGLALLVLGSRMSTAAEAKASGLDRPAPEASDVLQQYVAKADPSFRWTKRREGIFGKGKFVELILTSQTWHEVPWKHQLFLYMPPEVKKGSDVLIHIGGGRWNDDLEKPAAEGDRIPETLKVVSAFADAVHAPAAVLLQVPQQPMFGGMVEDQIIAYTFVRYFEDQTGDWPLLLPMVKSVVRAMDAIGEFAGDEWKLDVDHFMLTGASKRGWTTWLTSAVDPRVRALAPMVIDLLNLGPQMKLQEASFGGGYSERIEDYTRRGLQRMIATEKGADLQAIIDPYGYREQLKQPKLIILGTNDAYWPVDALNLYWDGLVGEKHILYVPNGEHGLRDYPRIVGTMAALHQRVVENKPLPKLDWKFEEAEGGLVLSLDCDVKPTKVSAWTANCANRDFRKALWTAQPATTNGHGDKSFACKLAKPESGCVAMFCEAEFNGQSLPFFLSTNIRVLEAEKADERK